MTYGELCTALEKEITDANSPAEAAEKVLGFFERLGWLNIFEEH